MLIKALVLLSLPKVVLQEARLKMKKKIHVAFLDIKAAYDSVDRRILCVRNAFLTMLFLFFIYY